VDFMARDDREEHKEVRQKVYLPIDRVIDMLHISSIFQYLPDADLSRFSQTSRTMHADSGSRSILQEKASKKLLSHVVKAEEGQALSMIKLNPKLLLYPSEAIDYSGRCYQGYTPWQAALLCQDVVLCKNMEPLFDRCFANPEEGQIAKERQSQAIFPNGLPKQEHFNFDFLIEMIARSSEEDINAALNKIHNDTAICQALTQFRSQFSALALEEVFFNPSHLITALTIYDEHFDDWPWEKRDLFWRQIIGYIQRFVPACFAQALVQTLSDILDNEAPLRRELNFRWNEVGGESYFPLLDSSGLGFDFAVCGLRGPVVDNAPKVWGCLRNYVKEIQAIHLSWVGACEVSEVSLAAAASSP